VEGEPLNEHSPSRAETTICARARTFAGELADLREISRWTREVCAATGLTPDRALDLELCLNEVAANIIHHGYDRSGPRPFSIWLTPTEGGVQARVEDFGRPFDPTRAPERDAPASLTDLTVGGYGIQIVRNLAQNLRYRRDGNRNVLTFGVSRPTGSP